MPSDLVSVQDQHGVALELRTGVDVVGVAREIDEVA
jgi:hypothetical protein